MLSWTKCSETQQQHKHCSSVLCPDWAEWIISEEDDELGGQMLSDDTKQILLIVVDYVGY